ncbi:hypothetical protein [Salinibacter sp.]|uniref:hypothetical protein n=1 Tax=Salinibacter sp. TaxID=2065818 RepID=UPI0021E8AA8F|nr:hypothetical protein [Salinibacter sp.]
MSEAKLLLSLFALLFILGACQGEGKVEGEVFIVTEGRENVEMGLVDVKGIRTSVLDQHLEERHSRSKKETQLRAEKFASLLDSLSVTQQVLEKRKDRYEKLKEKYEEISAAYRATLRSFNPSPKASPGNKVAVALGKSVELKSEPNFSSAMAGYMSGGNIGKILSVENKKVNTFLKIRTENGVVGYTPYIGKFVELEEKVVRFKEKLSSKLEETKKKYELQKEISKGVLDNLDKTRKEIIRHRQQEFYFAGMPNPDVSDKTGSDGTYELTVEAGVSHYVVAEAERSIGDENERYYWMVETTVEGGETKEVNLSNDNLGGVADKKYALSERTLSTVRGIWQSAVSLAKEGEEMDWEKLIYRTAFPQDSTDLPIPDDLNVPEDKLLSNR